MADSEDLPIILYNIPLFVAPIPRDVVARLSSRKNIAGLKDSSGNMVEMMHYIDQVRSAGNDINYMVGREEILAPALTAGASGCMTGCAGIIPEIMVGIWDAHHAGDFAKANRLQQSMLPLVRAMFAAPFPVGFKAALEMRGFDMDPQKQPLAVSEEKNLNNCKEQIKTVLKGLLELIKTEVIDK